MIDTEIENLINNVENIIKTENLSYYDFFRLKESIKTSPWYEGDEPDTDDLIEMLSCNYISMNQKDKLLDLCEASDYYELIEENNRLESSTLKPKTLDDEYKNEIVLKLLKVTSSSQELEELLGEEVMNKIKYLVL